MLQISKTKSLAPLGRSVLHWSSVLISGALACAFGFTLFFPVAARLTGNPYPSLLGFRQAIVLSNSMAPTLAAGDLILIQSSTAYQIGDVLTYADRHGLVTHRFIANGEEGLVLQGDANRTPDSPILPEQVLGKTVLRLPAVGQLARWLRAGR